MQKIKGYTFEEVAASKKEQLTKDYNILKKREEAIYKNKKELEKQLDFINEIELKDLEIEKMRYRITSVDRVLDYLRSNATKLTPKDIGTYLCHCQNKLFGNIDGTELELDFTNKEAHNA